MLDPAHPQLLGLPTWAIPAQPNVSCQVWSDPPDQGSNLVEQLSCIAHVTVFSNTVSVYSLPCFHMQSRLSAHIFLECQYCRQDGASNVHSGTNPVPSQL